MTVADVQSVVRDAIRARSRVAARGFGTWGGAVPDDVQVVDMRGMCAVVEYDPADLTVTVEAGCPLSVLAATLAERAQRLAVDVPSPERTTVGGMIAAGLGRMLRDQVIGIEWVGGEGQVLRSGGRVVKNVAGYDLMKMHVGARGRFGVVTKATFKVRPEAVVGVTHPPTGPRAANAAHADHPAVRLRERLAEALDPNGVFAPAFGAPTGA